MKLRRLSAVLFLFFVLLLAGCQNASNNSEPNTESDEALLTATIELVDVDDNEVDSKTVEFEEGQNLMDVAKENFDVTEKDGFLNTIGELIPDADKQEFISITVNGEMAMTGASDIELNEDDVVTFSIEVWE